jgi:two-component system response regulator HydG/two-component system response regulator AtoC
MNRTTIMIAERDRPMRNELSRLLSTRGFRVVVMPWGKNCHEILARESPDLLITGSCLLAEQICTLKHDLPIILITQNSSEKLLLSALRIGVRDCFKVPVNHDELLHGIGRCLGQVALPAASREEGNVSLVGDSRLMQETTAYIKKLARSNSNVLITGETGTGKELAAELLHACSARKSEPLVCVNCAALPETLVESELFGHEKGAFTGALTSRGGRFEQAHNGTIFLDEISQMSLHAQAKILRVIENKKVCRVGGQRDVEVNMRSIAASNDDLERLVAEKKFREDLYYRLNVGRVHMPSLRERKEDIPSLVQYYINRLNRTIGSTVQGFTDESWNCLMACDWPGNVRQLKNVVEASFIDLPSREIEFIRLPDQVRRCLLQPLQTVATEKEQLLAALTHTRWNKSQAAAQLNWSRMTLYRKIKKYSLKYTM